MKRTAILLLALSIRLVLPAWGQNAVIQSQGTTGVPTKTPRSDASLQWKDVGGKQVLKIWELEGADEYPQIALMRVTNSEYLAFSQDPSGFVKFVNDDRVFSKPVIVAGPWVTLSSVDEQGKPAFWVLTLVHGKRSTLIVGAMPKLIQEVANSKTK